ncbi:hypothetical protein GJ744_005767 [Endocarpon pusillum]|uniref:Uncharacterized protein n=1 Tax=Endocarpon pusillum TaxID=364733 RepID=A0A8H7AQ48_9EURO|nr:hypothetical protein GJ744_005767 [Endocarpon pusillum]
MPHPNDHAVGWICALTVEYVAAQALLDEKHHGPDFVSPNDDNDYTLGKLGNIMSLSPSPPNGSGDYAPL